MIEKEAHATALEYGFKWFEYHANQRIAIFNFYLIIYTGLAAAYSFLLKEKILVGSVLISFLMILMSILFWQLDVRTRQLIEIGERIVKENWANVGLGQDINPIVLSQQNQDTGFRYRQIFGAVFSVGGTFGILTLGYALAGLG